ncbi:MAG TPA: PadR family transcriptional regulator [Steroidobacteraceae bacterium]|jgi:DNA-binding PadR family transcriptional regulator|nr:PadR family transcriptional regulator [Steroidobacteraceae bacterium]
MSTPFDRDQWRRFGGFAAGFGDGLGMIGKALLAGRRLASGELQLVLLAQLAERARHGYELIKALEERSGGFYSPSPGMVYPALSWLEEMGYASVVAEGSRKLYSITDGGRTYLKENREAADAMLRQLEYIGRRMGRVREIFGGLDDEDELGEHGIGAARRELRRALREKHGASSEEKDRVAKILREAAARIRGAG